MAQLVADLRFASRLLRKTPVFTAVVVLTLGLGIGANTAIFSVVNALLLTPLPYPESGQLVMVWQDMRARGGPAKEWTGNANQFDWKAETQVFSGVTTIRNWTATLTGGDLPEPVNGEQTTYEYFSVLGAKPALGRTFLPADDVPNAPRVVVLSHALWVSHFGGDPAVVGTMVPINGEAHQVIGVMPASFRPAWFAAAEMWRPLRWDPASPPREIFYAHTIGRLQPGVTLPQARAALDALAVRLAQQHPETDKGRGINPVPLQEQQVAGVRTGLFVLLGAVGFVLLIACVNIANLLLARASGRRREIAVRRALGAGRLRILRQVLTESVLLAVAGGFAGIMAGEWGTDALKAIAPAATPRLETVAIDGHVLAFAATLSILTGLVFGMVPAWFSAREVVTPALGQGGRGHSGDGGSPVRSVLVVAELALALMLLVGAGLLVRTFTALQHADLGFNPDNLVTGFILPPAARYKTAGDRRALYDRVLERMRAVPGVRDAALSSVIPLGGDSDTDITIAGRPKPGPNERPLTVWYRDVSANYFAVMGIPLKHGRLFTNRDSAPVAVINETMAARFWPREDPIGRRVDFGDGRLFTIVGIVGDVQGKGPREDRRVEIYVPYAQQPEAGTNIVLSAAVAPASLLEPMKRAMKDVDPEMAVSSPESMAVTLSNAVGPERFYAQLVGAFAAIALLLAGIGIYGVLSFAVAQRRREIGVRVALGAGRGQIFGMILGDSLKLAAAGVVAGIAGALALGRALRTLLYGVTAFDPITIAATAAILLAVAVMAGYFPARRALTVNPTEALRAD